MKYDSLIKKPSARFSLMILVVSMLFISGCTSPPTQNNNSTPINNDNGSDFNGVKGVFVVDGNETSPLKLETAITRREQARGLMGRKNLAENSGMIFIFDGERVRGFWMKNTLIPLDMIFLDENLTVVKIQHARPEAKTPKGDFKTYSSEVPAKFVIEVNRGYSNRTGLEEGDKFRFLDR